MLQYLRKLVFVSAMACFGLLFVACGQQDKVITSLEEFDQPGVFYAAQTGAGSTAIAEAYFQHAGEKQYTALADCIQAVKSGKADGVTFDVNILNYYRNMDPDSLSLLSETLPTEREMGVAVSRKTKIPGLLDQSNAFLDASRADGTLDDMFQRWVVEGNEELPEIAQPEQPDGTIYAGFLGTMAPFNYIKDDKRVGYDVELMQRFALYANKKLEFRSENQAGYIADLETGTIDLISANVYMSRERREVVDFSQTLYTSHTGVMIRNPEKAGSQKGFPAGLIESFRKTVIRESRWKMILNGLLVTLILACGAVLLGTLTGFVLCLLGRSRSWILSRAVQLLCRLVTGVPMLVTLMLFFYVLFAGTGLSEIMIAILAFALDFGVHVRALLDTGIRAVAPGEVEAARALGFSGSQTFRKVILPQAVAHVMPLYNGQIVTLVKATSIVGYIAINDLTKVSDIIRSMTFEAFFPIVITAIIYFFLSSILALLVEKIGNRIFPERRAEV